MSRLLRPTPTFAALVVGLLAIAGAIYYRDSPISITINIPAGSSIRIHTVETPSLERANVEQRQHAPVIHSPEEIRKNPLQAEKLSLDQARALTAITAFHFYSYSAQQIIDIRRAVFERLPPKHRPIADAIGHSKNFEAAELAVAQNAPLMRSIADYARDAYGIAPDRQANSVNYELVSDFLGHVVRDWTEEGSAERDTIHSPILTALQSEFSGGRGTKRILLPGFGLGRLAHEIAKNKDFKVDACELDYGSVIPYRWLLNNTSHALQHSVHPFIHKWQHQGTRTSRFRATRFPDMLPTTPVRLVEGDFLTQFPDDARYDAIVTLFFIDVSEDAMDFIENIYRLLKPGGLWINLGPFKWGKHSQLQLSAEEMLDLSRIIGFTIDQGSRRTIEAVYGHQIGSLLQYTYGTQFWTAHKPLKQA
ncbi:N2227-like protein-domain-containing protein [Gloeopeniophorella convolvens]|nr:N2227-like protein-domain-containing protein [Gloeopeniophorella convolvens]